MQNPKNASQDLGRHPVCVPVLILVALTAISATMTKGRIPHKRDLIARVNLLYQAYQKQDRKAFQDLIHPQMLECISNLDTTFFEGWGSIEHLEIVSWDVRSIQAQEDPRKEPIADCKGKPLRGDGTALVFIGQTDRKGNERRNSGVVSKFWVHVNDIWYWVPPL